MGRRPELPSRRGIALALPLIPLAAAVPRGKSSQAAAADVGSKSWPGTAILLRHAEKSADGDPRDPSLSESGRKRSKALATLLSRASATHLFASEFKRTQETLAPLAELAKLQVLVVPGGKTAELAGRILELPSGSVAVVAGHSNTIPALATLLGGSLAGLETTPQGPVIPDGEYGRLYVVTPAAGAAGKASVLELVYG